MSTCVQKTTRIILYYVPYVLVHLFIAYFVLYLHDYVSFVICVRTLIFQFPGGVPPPGLSAASMAAAAAAGLPPGLPPGSIGAPPRLDLPPSVSLASLSNPGAAAAAAAAAGAAAAGRPDPPPQPPPPPPSSSNHSEKVRICRAASGKYSTKASPLTPFITCLIPSYCRAIPPR